MSQLFMQKYHVNKLWRKFEPFQNLCIATVEDTIFNSKYMEINKIKNIQHSTVFTISQCYSQ